MKRFGVALVLALSASLLGACVQFPTEKQQSVDLRPQISFVVSSPAQGELEVFVDGLAMGRVSDFLAGQQALRVLTGSHVIRLMSGSHLVKEERIYIGDGMTKIIAVN